MNKKEHLELIINYCNHNLDLAAKRTPGKWHHQNENIYAVLHGLIFAVRFLGGANEEGIGNATFVTACASGAAEAGWRATIAAINTALDCESWDGMIHKMYLRPDAEKIIDDILEAYPLDLIQQ